MTAELTNHLWQSTWFALVAALLTLACRGNRAQVRYWLWFSASLKFLAPFSLLISFGGRLERLLTPEHTLAPIVSGTISERMVQVIQPFPDSLPSSTAQSPASWFALAIIGVWVFGFGAIALKRLQDWRRVRASIRSGTPIHIFLTIEVRSSPALLEPAVAGWFRPVLLLPEGITESLAAPQLEAVLAHELCHVRRRDNLFSLIHMFVEAVFWFHPLVWWIGARLVEERELACDEEVLRLGNQPRVYAEAILSVCRSYLESPLRCVAGVSGPDLKKRIQAILAGCLVVDLNLTKKAMLTVAGSAAVALPFIVGVTNAPEIRAQSVAANRPKFEVASIKLCKDGESMGARGSRKGGRGAGVRSSPGNLYLGCQPLDDLIRFAYLGYQDGEPWVAQGGTGLPRPSVSTRILFGPIKGSPPWVESDRYTVEAKAEGPQRIEMMRGPMMQALLEERFRLQIHRETRDMPVYWLTIAKGGPKLRAVREGECKPFDTERPPSRPTPGQLMPKTCGTFTPGNGGYGVDTYGQTIAGLCEQFSAGLDRDVIDKTGIAGAFDIHLDLSPASLFPGRGPSDPAAADTPVDAVSEISAAVQKLGLKLESAKGSGEFLVIDRVERPSEN